MSNPNASTDALPAGSPGFHGVPTSVPLPVLRVPMLDRERQLFAYEIVFHREPGDEQTLLQCVLSTITDGARTRLVRGHRAFLNMPAELLPEDSDVLLHQPRLGVVLQPFRRAHFAMESGTAVKSVTIDFRFELGPAPPVNTSLGSSSAWKCSTDTGRFGSQARVLSVPATGAMPRNRSEASHASR